MIILKVTKKQGVTQSLEKKVSEKQLGKSKIDSPALPLSPQPFYSYVRNMVY